MSLTDTSDRAVALRPNRWEAEQARYEISAALDAVGVPDPWGVYFKPQLVGERWCYGIFVGKRTQPL